jgi:hypothetical protein
VTDKQRIIRLLEGMWINERKRPDSSGLVNPSEERCDMLNELSWALDQILDLGNGDAVASANVWGSFLPSEVNLALVQALKVKP